jgi:hypothetical protein
VTRSIHGIHHKHLRLDIVRVRTASAQSAEVLGSLGDDIATELHNDAASGLSTDGDIKVNLRKRPALERMDERVKGQKIRTTKDKKEEERSILPLRSGFGSHNPDPDDSQADLDREHPTRHRLIPDKPLLHHSKP